MRNAAIEQHAPWGIDAKWTFDEDHGDQARRPTTSSIRQTKGDRKGSVSARDDLTKVDCVDVSEHGAKMFFPHGELGGTRRPRIVDDDPLHRRTNGICAHAILKRQRISRL